MYRLLLISMLALAFASTAFAQSTEYNKIEFYGGYSNNRVDVGDAGLPGFSNQHEGFNGFNAAVTGNVTRYVGLKFDLAGHFNQKTFPVGPPASIDVHSNLFNFLGGVQLKDNSKEGKFKPFAQALVGVARGRNRVEFNNIICAAVVPSPCANFTETDTGFGGAFGAGLDVRLNDRFDIRAVQVDYNPTRLFGDTQHNVRLGAGIVIH
jgi:opacity protein-like surface antigen